MRPRGAAPELATRDAADSTASVRSVPPLADDASLPCSPRQRPPCRICGSPPEIERFPNLRRLAKSLGMDPVKVEAALDRAAVALEEAEREAQRRK
jgi:hypothetical protein